MCWNVQGMKRNNHFQMTQLTINWALSLNMRDGIPVGKTPGFFFRQQRKSRWLLISRLLLHLESRDNFLHGPWRKSTEQVRPDAWLKLLKYTLIITQIQDYLCQFRHCNNLLVMVHFSTYAIYLSAFLEFVGNQLTQPVKVHKWATTKEGVKEKHKWTVI